MFISKTKFIRKCLDLKKKLNKCEYDVMMAFLHYTACLVLLEQCNKGSYNGLNMQ
jgi:hypothetical protein